MSTNENKIYIPNFTYPFKKLTIEEEYHKSLSKEEKGNYLFNKFGLWHGGIHFSGQTLSEVQPSEGIRAISDGELVALRINKKYIEDDKEAIYSNGFFLLKHYLEYPVGNKLTFFSLYMHTAKKDKYDFSTHKVIGTNRFLRKGISYKEEDKLEELAEDTKITLGEEVGKDRYKVLYVENTSRTDNATIHSTNIKEIENSFNLKTINRDTPTDIITFPKEKIEIKAGEVVGLIGEYNRSTTGINEQLHLEVFTKDDVKIFAQKAKEEYEKNKEDKPNPTQIKIPRDIKEYEKEKILVITSSLGYTNLRKAYSKTELGYKTIKVLNSDIEIQIDESTLSSNRYLVTKIEEADVKEQAWTVHKNYIKESFKFKETNNAQSEDKIIKINEIKKEKDKKNKEYLEIEGKYFLYSDCKELHPITFDWAKVFDVESNDKISIFENLQEVLNPSFFDKVLGNDEEGLKLNSKFKELFDAIDEDSDGNLEIQELEEAVKDITIKKLTSKYIVKHPSEWKYEKNKWGSIEEILEKEEDKKHFENENKRIETLQLFDECKGIPDFPQDDMVYHFNPIGLVGEFVQKNKCYCLEQRIISSSCNGDGLSILNEHYEKLANELGVEKEVLKAVATVETGSRGAFQREKPKHATILYERHYFRNLITSVSKTNNSNGTITITGKAFLEGLEKTKTITISSSLPLKEIERKMRKIKIEAAAYFSNKYPDLIGNQGNYGTFNSQLVKLKRAKLLDEGKAIQSCSWGRFQVMGKYYNLVYNTPQELEKSQNQCELQHLVLFKEYLKNFDVIEPMKNKNWHLIARRYNGPSYAINNYHIKMENEYNKYKKEW